MFVIRATAQSAFNCAYKGGGGTTYTLQGRSLDHQKIAVPDLEYLIVGFSRIFALFLLILNDISKEIKTSVFVYHL